jgi:hypothetical protein
MSHSWLQKKRKGELIELAQTAKLPEYVQDDVLRDVESLINVAAQMVC